MSTNWVKIFYGPSDSFYTNCHKPQKLRGLVDQLRRIGYRVDIKPTEHINYCVLELCGHEVFRCNIKNLSFNTPCEYDPVCRRAVDAVVDATAKFNYARTYLWTWMLIDQQMFKRSDYAPKDYWQFDINVEPFNIDCVNCCGIFVKKKTDK